MTAILGPLKTGNRRKRRHAWNRVSGIVKEPLSSAGWARMGRDTNPFPITTYSAATNANAREIGRAGKLK